jgi:hypothetical protein
MVGDAAGCIAVRPAVASKSATVYGWSREITRAPRWSGDIT